jgi:unsaturated rhamnogalacturonyl hydrolase
MKKLLLFFVCLCVMDKVSAQTKNNFNLEDLRIELVKKWPHNRTVNIVFHGHSVPTGYANTPNVRTLDAYPHQLLHGLKELYPWAVINVFTTSIGGEQAEQGVKRFEKEVLCHRPDVLYIDYALNDRSIGLERAGKAWDKMICMAQKQGIKVILLTPTPDITENILDDNAPLEQHSRQIRILARKYGTGLVDSYSFFKQKAKNGEDLKQYMAQSNHPNAKGHAVVAKLLMKHYLDENQWNEYNKLHTMEIARKVADNQIIRFEVQVSKGSRWPNSHAYWAWTNATMYKGLAQLAQYSNDSKYWNFLQVVCDKSCWKPGPSIYFADDLCIIQTYVAMYTKFQKKKMLKPSINVLDSIIANPKVGSLEYYAPGSHTRWCWCDALFMAPPSFACIGKVTGDDKYYDFMDAEFRVAYDTLWDAKERLFFRDTRYKSMTEANGKRVFWGRGNAWVVGALVTILDNMPSNRASRRFYETLFVQLMERVVQLQDKQGFWHSSLLDASSYPMPETSASGLFTYGLFWGINHGLLNKKKYTSIAVKAWEALCTVVDADGKVGFVQPIGADPKSVNKEDTEVYGTGAFLLAACEYINFLETNKIL